MSVGDGADSEAGIGVLSIRRKPYAWDVAGYMFCATTTAKQRKSRHAQRTKHVLDVLALKRTRYLVPGIR